MTDAAKPAAPAIGQFTQDFKDQLLIALLARLDGKVRLSMAAIVRDSDKYQIVMRREADGLTLRLEKKQ